MLRCVPILSREYGKEQAIAICYSSFKNGRMSLNDSYNDYPESVKNNAKKVLKWREKVEGIDHIVVLMLENRSFDHMLGLLQHDSPEFNGVTPGDPALDNPLVNGKNVAVWSGEGPYFVKEGPGHSHLLRTRLVVGPRH